MQETRAGDVPFRVRAAARFVIGEIVAAVADDPVRIVEMARELVGGKRGCVNIVYRCGSSSRRTNSWKCRMPSSSGDW